MARKTFLNGYPLPASDLNTYLMDQTVQTYADATARTAALATPTEGQVSYLADTNTAYVYDGSSWNAVVDAKNYGATLPNGAAGKNKVINGGFDFWQRGTSATTGGYSAADRWRYDNVGGTYTISKQTFTPGTAPVSGYEAEAFYRLNLTVASGYQAIAQRIEDVRTLAGQTATLSFWAKTGSANSIAVYLDQNFGSGGSTEVTTTLNAAQALTTGWVRYSFTVAVPSISGKTVGSSSYLQVRISVGTATTYDFWGVQVEAGSVATPFSRAGGTLQGELAACQRYYYRATAVTAYGPLIPTGMVYNSTQAVGYIQFPVTMRDTPSSIEFSNIAFGNYADSFFAMSSVVLSGSQKSPTGVQIAGTISGGTAGQVGRISGNNNSAAYLGFSAEL